MNAGGDSDRHPGFAITISKTLVHGTGSPDGGLTKVGNGTLTLSTNASTFTGNVAINQGTVVLNTGNLGLNAATSAAGQSANQRPPDYGGRRRGNLLSAHDVFGNATSDPLVQVIVNGGNLTTDGHLITLGPLAMNNGSLVASNSSAIGYGYNLNGLVTVTGGTSTMTSAGSRYYLNDTGTFVTPFDVAAGAALRSQGRCGTVGTTTSPA